MKDVVLMKAFVVTYVKTMAFPILFVTAILFSLSSIGVFGNGWIVFFAIMLPFTLGGGFVNSTYSKNVSWITSLPISRMRLLLQTILGTLMIVLLFGLYSYVVAQIAIATDPNPTYVKSLKDFFSHQASNYNPFYVSVFLPFFVLAAIGVCLPQKKFMSALRERTRAIWSVQERLTFAGLLLATIVVWYTFSSFWLFMAFMTAVLLWIIYWPLSITFSFQPRERRVFKVVACTIWVVILGGQATIVRHQLFGNHVTHALVVREKIPTQISPWSDARYLELAQNSSTLSDYSEVLFAWSRAHRVSPKDSQPTIPIQLFPVAALTERRPPNFLKKSLEYVRWDQVPLTFIQNLSVLTQSNLGDRVNHRLSEWAKRDLSPREFSEIMNHESEAVKALGLMWAAFRPTSEVYLTVSHGVFKQPSQKLLSPWLESAALDTLGRISLKNITRVTVMRELSQGRWLASRGAVQVPDCDELLQDYITQVTVRLQRESKSLSYCLDQRAFKKGGEELVGYISRNRSRLLLRE